MKNNISLLLFTILSLSIYAQKIEYSNDNFFKSYFYQQEGNSDYLSLKDIQSIVEENSETLAYIKKGRRLTTLSYITSGVSSIFLGMTISDLISSDEKVNLTHAGIGLGLVAISIPISKNATKNILKGIDTYNSSYNPTDKNKVEISLKGNINNIGLCILF
jgi:hypothetical protein